MRIAAGIFPVPLDISESPRVAVRVRAGDHGRTDIFSDVRDRGGARELNGDLRLILPTMGLVVLVIAVIVVNYRQLGLPLPGGGGAPAATG